jgi:hypothetical protein
MVKIVEMDERVKLEEQLEEDVGSVILLNKFNVNQQSRHIIMYSSNDDLICFGKFLVTPLADSCG